LRFRKPGGFEQKQRFRAEFPNLYQDGELRCGKQRWRSGIVERRTSMAASKTGASKRGFAAMDPAKQREIASKGGKASHGGGRKSSRSR
jgi:uncharacterized protein